MTPVKLDGNVLFTILGISAIPAEERANIIGQRIKSVAANYDISAESTKTVEEDGHILILAGNILILNIYAPDANMEGVSLKILYRRNP